MNRETQIQLGREMLGLIESRTTAMAPATSRNPVSSFTDPEVLRLEQELLFRREPLVLGFSAQLPNPGDFLTEDLSGVPVLMTRTKDGSVAAMLNVCRHRGARVVPGRMGTGARGFSCPYHGWSYDLSGRLDALPCREGFPDVDPASVRLRPLPVVERHGMIWVRPQPGDAIDLDRHLEGLGPELETFGVERFHFHASRLIRREMNWKMVVDTFLETYHFAALHGATVGPIFFPNLNLFHPFGRNLRQTVPRRSILALRDLPEPEWDVLPHTAVVYVLFPNTVFLWLGDHVEVWRPFPDGDRVDRCVMRLDFLTPEPPETDGAREHWTRNLDLAVATVENEDFPVNESIQRGLLAGAQDHLTYGRNEPALAHFEAAIRHAIKSRS